MLGVEIPLELLRSLPKTDLHCHLDGSLRLDTVIELARKQNVKLPTFDRDGAQRRLGQADERGSSLGTLEDPLGAAAARYSQQQPDER